MAQDSPAFKTGDEVILIRPDGKEIKAKIGGILMTNPSSPEDADVWFNGLTKEDIPIGTEVL
ncbi:MAG: hypothetical protein M3384_09240, partial [Acidobacteriota bacterium]|nr:hypothetical protein [Acidobacteriota bacterium]